MCHVSFDRKVALLRLTRRIEFLRKNLNSGDSKRLLKATVDALSKS